MMRVVSIATAFACSAALLLANGRTARANDAGVPACASRVEHVDGRPLSWHQGRSTDASALEAWCRAVGAPVFAPALLAAGFHPPRLEDLVVLTWNAHLADGRLTELIEQLRAGALTGGRPVRHFVLLVQELYRRGDSVPAFAADARSAFAIIPRDPDAPDAEDYAASLGLSLLYVPSMRNGAQLPEDRGNAIISTEPLIDPLALELPLERQRRVAISASIQVTIDQRVVRLELFNAHLEPLSSPKSLWIFKNPRGAQARAILDLLTSPRFSPGPPSAGTVLGGDFNIVQRGVKEDAYVEPRAWSRSLAAENQRNTHAMGRIDHLFFRLADGWSARTMRIEKRFGSDHHPVLGRFAQVAGLP